MKNNLWRMYASSPSSEGSRSYSKLVPEEKISRKPHFYKIYSLNKKKNLQKHPALENVCLKPELRGEPIPIQTSALREIFSRKSHIQKMYFLERKKTSHQNLISRECMLQARVQRGADPNPLTAAACRRTLHKGSQETNKQTKKRTNK